MNRVLKEIGYGNVWESGEKKRKKKKSQTHNNHR
jgi:hypothetical protein